MRSNFTCEVIRQVKKSKNRKSAKSKIVFGFLAKVLVTTGWKFAQFVTSLLSTNVIVERFPYLDKIKNPSSPPGKRTTTPTTTTIVPWSGLCRRQKHYILKAEWNCEKIYLFGGGECCSSMSIPLYLFAIVTGQIFAIMTDLLFFASMSIHHCDAYWNSTVWRGPPPELQIARSCLYIF